MKYCAKCGTPMSDDTTLCPKCYPQVNHQHSQNTPSPQILSKNHSEKKTNKTSPLIILNTILTAVILIALITMYFISPSNHNSTNGNNSSSTGNITSGSFNSTCPASEYGNHNWASANCTEPAKCYNCDAYKDDEYGNHEWTSANCTEPTHCRHCNEYKDDKLGEHFFYTREDDGLCYCTHCGMLYDVYIKSFE